MMLSSVALNMSANLEGPAVAQDWKRSILSSQFPRRAVLKNVQTVGQLHSSPMQMLKIEENNRRGFRKGCI